MLGIEITLYDLHFSVGDARVGQVLSVTVKWSEHASDVESDEEHTVEWHLNFHPLSMRGGRRSTTELRGYVLEAVRRYLEQSEGRWSALEIRSGQDGEVDEYDITITYRARMHPPHLETVRGLVEGIATTLGGILESHGALRPTA